MEGTAAAGIEARDIADRAIDEIDGQEGREGDIADARQFLLHMIVERLELTLGSVQEHLVETFLGLAGEDGDAKLLGDFDVGLHLFQHGEAA